MDPTHADASLQLVFQGECLAGHDPQLVSRAVTAALKLDAKRAARLFSGQRVVLRREVSEATARRYIAWFAQMGAALHAEPSSRRAEQAPTPAAPPTARAAGRRRRGIGMAGLAGALVFGLGVWPGLDALWPQTPAPSTESTAAASEAAGNAAPPPSPPVAAAGEEAPKDMSADARREHQLRYLPAPGHKAFAISSNGAHAWQAGALSQNQAREGALAACMQALPPSRDGCRIVDADGQWEE